MENDEITVHHFSNIPNKNTQYNAYKPFNNDENRINNTTKKI